MMLLLTVPGKADARGYRIPMPTDFDQVDVYLLTVGRGPTVYALYGHTILRVVDRSNNADNNFNWGIFDFRSDNFVWNFYVGNLNYQLAVTDFHYVVDHYRNYEQRGMIQDKINLTNKQKETLLKRLIWNGHPDNIFYQYNQFLDNCATKPRDYIDEAIGGKIKELYANRPAGVNLRHHIRFNASPVWWVDVGLDTVSNKMLDMPATNWQEMFLPGRLRELLAVMPAYDDEGNTIPGKNLLEGAEVIIDIPDPPNAVDPYYVIGLISGLGIVLASLFVLSGTMRDAPPASRSRASYAVLGMALVAFGLWSAFWGTAMTFNWVFSRYPEVQANRLLFLYWPLDWLLALLGFWYMVKGRPFPGLTKRGKIMVSLGILHMAGIATAAVLYGVGAVDQNILPHLLLAGVPGLLLYWVVLRAGLTREAA
jgi:hypothetical protein